MTAGSSLGGAGAAQSAQAPVLFGTLDTASGHRFGRATLNAPASLNALSLAMVDLLDPQLQAWAADPAIAGVILDASGEKAFCAGGDVVGIYHAIRATPAGQVPTEAAAFFEREYRLDYRIHRYPKPLLCWGHGIVMGGGLGLLAGASHRVATPRTRIAMPEVAIGLYPDVGGSWILARMPARRGLFLALTGVALDAADARFVGLVDAVLPQDAQQALLAAIADTHWQGEQAGDAATLDALLAALAAPDEALPAGPMRAQIDRIDALMAASGLTELAPGLAALANDADPWLAQAGTGFTRGSPTSVALGFAMQQRARELSLADTFRLELQASVACCMHHDFPEGVRALLVDKDRKPRWQPATLSEVSEAHVAAHLRPFFDGPHPLADLG